MQTANERQVAGDHYKQDYQHWDFVCDAKLPYLLGCATKYVSRWRKKNGKVDLQKAEHYLQKAIERGITPDRIPLPMIERFSGQHETADGDIIFAIAVGAYGEAMDGLRRLIGDA